jgi:hypothetical protein
MRFSRQKSAEAKKKTRQSAKLKRKNSARLKKSFVVKKKSAKK